jgi:hypothetical protein
MTLSAIASAGTPRANGSDLYSEVPAERTGPATPRGSSPRTSASRFFGSATVRAWSSHHTAGDRRAGHARKSSARSRSKRSTRPSGTPNVPMSVRAWSGCTGTWAGYAPTGSLSARTGPSAGWSPWVRRCAGEAQAISGLSMSMPSVRCDPHPLQVTRRCARLRDAGHRERPVLGLRQSQKSQTARGREGHVARLPHVGQTFGAI